MELVMFLDISSSDTFLLPDKSLISLAAGVEHGVANLSESEIEHYYLRILREFSRA